MNGPMKMYRTRQIIRHDVPITLPTCMYKLKNIHSGRNGMVDGSSDHVSSADKKLDIVDQVKQFLKNNQHIPGMAELEAKQEEILKQLAELKQQILSIKSNLKLNDVTNQQSTKTFNITECSKGISVDLPDVVINVNPNIPPYSLAAIQKILSDVVALKFTCHLHSTVSSLPENTKYLESVLLKFKTKANLPEIHLRLIWKNISSNVEVLVSFVPILGEVNLLRYLTSAFSSVLSYNQAADSILIDSILDLCYQLVRAKTKTEKTSLVQSLNKFLGKSEWLLGRNNASIADIAAYSAIQQISGSNDLSVNLKKWHQRCVSVF